MLASCPCALDAYMESPDASRNCCGLCRQDDHACTCRGCPVKLRAKHSHRERARSSRSTLPPGPYDCAVPTTNGSLAHTQDNTLLLPGPNVSFINGPTYGDVAKRGKSRRPSDIPPPTRTPIPTPTPPDGLMVLGQRPALLQEKVWRITHRRAFFARSTGRFAAHPAAASRFLASTTTAPPAPSPLTTLSLVGAPQFWGEAIATAVDSVAS